MPAYKYIGAGILLALLSQTAIAAPALQDLEGASVTKDKRDDSLKGLRIASDDEIPPAGSADKRSNTIDIEKRADMALGGLADCAKKAQPDWPKIQLTKEQSDTCAKQSKKRRSVELGAPTSITSSDGKYTLGSICTQKNDIPKYFLFGGDFQDSASGLCEKALSYVDPNGGDNSKLQPTSAPMWGAALDDVRARRKIAATIWHTPNQKMGIIVGTINLGMDNTADAKKAAFGLCTDAVNYLGNTCLVGISGTVGDIKPKFQHESQKPGTVTWTDKSGGKPAIAFDFSLENY